MSGFEDQKAMASGLLVQKAVDGNSDIPAGALERNTISTARSRREYALDVVAENAGYETIDIPSLPMTRVDAAKLIRALQQLEGIAKRQAPRIAFKAKGKILLLDLADILAVQAEGNYVSLRHQRSCPRAFKNVEI